jgi:hypothetical protein
MNAAIQNLKSKIGSGRARRRRKMATQTWLGNAAAVAQVSVLTPASPSVNDTFTVTCNSKAVSYQTAVGTVADVCNGVANAILRR